MKKVALRKESVDRNSYAMPNQEVFRASLSARRAWIEINADTKNTSLNQSLSARRAWIEIGYGDYVQYNYDVALRKESVDRNA